MASRFRRPSRPIRKTIFVGCEGEDEVAFIRFLDGLCRKEKKTYSLDTYNTSGGGPTNTVNSSVRARDRIGKREFAQSFILADADRMKPTEPGYEKARKLADTAGFRIILSRPCIEVRIYRIITKEYYGHVTKQEAIRALQPTWPHFGERRLSARELESRINLDMLRDYAQTDPELKALLAAVTLIE
jgi:hypothetical protein